MIKNSFLIFLSLTFLSSNLSGMKSESEHNKKVTKLAEEFKELREKVHNSAHIIENAQHNFTYTFMNGLSSGAAHALADIAIKTAFNWGTYGVKKIYYKAFNILDLEDIPYKQGLIKTDLALRNNQQALINNDIATLDQIQRLMNGCSPERKKNIQKKYDYACELFLDNLIKYEKSIKQAPWPTDQLRQDPKLFNTPNPAFSRLGVTDIPVTYWLAKSIG